MTEARTAAKPATVVKRSLTIAGHRTSISLEDAFWAGLREAADARGLAVAALVADVDRGRGAANLSSALRVHVLEACRSRGTTQGERHAGDARGGDGLADPPGMAG